MDEYIVSRLDDSSYQYIQELYLASFHKRESITGIDRKYNTLYTGVKNIGYLAFDSRQRPAAYYGVFPMILTSKGKDVLVAQSGDTMTAPGHRGKGLFVKLAQLTYQLAWDNEIGLVFGFPNENSFPGFKKKLNWEFHGCMKQFSFQNPTLPLGELCSTKSFLSSMYRPFLKARLHPYRIPLNEETIRPFTDPSIHIEIKRDLQFFRYKLLNPDVFLIRIDGFSLLIKVDPHLLIGLVGYFTSDRVDAFVTALKKAALLVGCRKTILSISQTHWLYPYLLPIQTPIDTLPIGFLQADRSTSIEEISFSLGDYDTF